ncbi:MAG: hypothetical protein H0U12_10240 [Thermoleophilaceae bacterium]|nr:hypothetical protein [Thermoleophilaceae bacterium]
MALVIAGLVIEAATEGGSELGADCLVTNFGVELCGQDAVDHCQSWEENQTQIAEDAAESAEDARRLNRSARRDARRYGGALATSGTGFRRGDFCVLRPGQQLADADSSYQEDEE